MELLMTPDACATTLHELPRLPALHALTSRISTTFARTAHADTVTWQSHDDQLHLVFPPRIDRQW